jgi:hypothetical protein
MENTSNSFCILTSRSKVKDDCNKNKQLNNQSGQTFVEFLFLLLLVMGLSFGFLNISNRNLGDLWEVTVNKILDPFNTGEVDRVDLR